MAVGSNIGQVHKQRQGTGLATVLGGDAALAALGQYRQREEAHRLKKEQLAARQKLSAVQALQKFKNKDYWYKHDKELGTMYDRLEDLGTKIMQQGVANPFTGTDEASILFRKEADKLQRMSNFSEQIKGAHDKTLARFESDPKKWDLDSANKAFRFYDTYSLEEIVSRGLRTPTLKSKAPLADLMTDASGIMKTAIANNNDMPLEEKDIVSFVREYRNNPAKQEEVTNSLKTRWEGLSDVERARKEAEAASKGINPMEQLAVDVFSLYNKDAKPWDLIDFQGNVVKDTAGGLKTTTIGEEGVTTISQSGAKEAMYASVKGRVMSDPRAIPAFEKIPEVGIVGTDTESEKIAKIQDYAWKEWEPLVKKRFSKTRAVGAMTSKEREAQADLWYGDITSGQFKAIQEAAGYLRGTTMPDGTKVERAWANDAGGVILEVTTAMRSIPKTVTEGGGEDAVGDPIPGETKTVRELGTVKKQIVLWPNDPASRETMLNYFYEALKTNKGKRYPGYQTDVDDILNITDKGEARTSKGGNVNVPNF